MRWNLLVRLLGGLWPPAIVVPQFVRSEVALREPGARLESDDVEACLSERERGNTPDGSQTDDHDISLFQRGRHGLSLDRHGACAGLREHFVVVRGLVIRRHVCAEPLIVGRGQRPYAGISDQVPSYEAGIPAIVRV